MPTTYTSLLGLALPTTGELTGSWGTVVNDYITKYVDAAVAGAQTLSTDADATLTTTTGSSLGATSAQYAILNCTGARTVQRTITVPATSKVYLVLNATTGGQSVKVVGSGPTTGITVANGRAALIAWSGSDFITVASNDVNALAANALVVGGGVGAAPATITTGTGVVTALGNTTNATGGFATVNGTATLTNKRVDPRVSSAASASSLTPDISSFDQYAYTALAVDLTINAPIGTPVDGNKLVFRLLDNGTTRTLTWNATYTAIGVTLPTATTANKTTYVGCIYNANNTRWDVIAVVTQA